jgi:hypothetical protein
VPSRPPSTSTAATAGASARLQLPLAVLLGLGVPRLGQFNADLLGQPPDLVVADVQPERQAQGQSRRDLVSLLFTLALE